MYIRGELKNAWGKVGYDIHVLICIYSGFFWFYDIFLYISRMKKIEIGENLMFAILVIAMCIISVVGIIYSK